MAILGIKNTDSLKRIALKVDKNNEFFVTMLIGKTPVSCQVCMYLYRKNYLHTYNVEHNVLVFLGPGRVVYFVPYCSTFEKLLLDEHYWKDDDLWVPEISANNLKYLRHRLSWRIALLFVNS